MKKTFLFLTALVMSAMMWAETVTTNLTDKNWNVGEDEEAWTATGAATQSFESADPSRGVQITLANVKNSGLTLTNSSIKDLGGISKVELVYSSNTDKTSAGTIAVAVGSTALGDAYTIVKENNATISFENETAVVGDIVITFTSTQTSKSVYVKSITVTYSDTPTPARTLDSIYIAGTATKLEYTEGEEFDPAGLKVMGHYDTGDDTEITAGITWSSNPEVFALGDESVEVIAQIKNLESDPFIVNGIVVNAKPAAKYVPVAWDEIEDGGKYFITANNNGEYYFAAKAFAAGNATAIAFDASLAPEADMWIFTQDGDAWKISAADGEGLYMTNANNGLVCAADKGADFTVAQGSSAEFTKLTASDGTNDRCVALYNQQDFRSYKASTTSGIQDLKLYGLKKEGVVTKPSFTPTDADFDQEVEVTLSAEEGADIFYALNEAVTSMNAIPYTQPIVLTDTTTIYAVAKKDGKESEQVNKTYNLIPVFASLADLVANMPAGENPVKVKVTITSAAIDSFYVNKSGYRNGVYVTAANTAVELYEYNVPETWVAGGTVSGTIIAGWLSYNGILELQKWENGWDAISYTAPDPTALQEIMVNGNVRKLMHRGHIMILKDNKLFNLQGQLVK